MTTKNIIEMIREDYKQRLSTFMTVINLQPFFIEKWEQYLLSLRLMVVTEDERRLYKVFLQVPEEVQIIFT